MKTCPVCQAGTFDDAQVCYGCLYRFTTDGADLPAEAARDVSPPCENTALPPSFLIKLIPPTSGNDCSWRCAVEVVGP